MRNMNETPGEWQPVLCQERLFRLGRANGEIIETTLFAHDQNIKSDERIPFVRYNGEELRLDELCAKYWPGETLTLLDGE